MVVNSSINVSNINSNTSMANENFDTNLIVNSVSDTEKTNNENKSDDKEEKYNKKNLDEAISKLNKLLKPQNTRAEYSFHKDLSTIMIKVIDQDTDKVVLEIPSEKILNMVASMCKEMGILDKKA